MKEKLQNWFSKKGINYLISLVLIVIIIGTISVFFSNHTIQKQNLRKELAHKVILGVNEMTTMIMAGDVGIRGYMLISEERFLPPLTYARAGADSQLKEISTLLAAQNFGEMDTLAIVQEEIGGYIALLSQMQRHVKEGNVDRSLQLLAEDRGEELVTNYFKLRDKILSFEKGILESADAQSDTAIATTSTVQWLLIFLGIPTLCLVLFRIFKDGKSRHVLFHALADSNRQYIFNPADSEDIELEEKKVIDNIINNLKHASAFIKAITNGEYNVHWEGINEHNSHVNQENIAGELIQMREQMKKVKEADQRRLWATEGLSKIAEITRKYQHDIRLLSDKLVIGIVKYLNANQAGLFTVSENSKGSSHLELLACYAYERKKFLKKEIEFGEGLVGQAYLEGEPIYMTELPEDYIAITSGLGKAVPDCILIVPLKYNEEVMGVLEIASFHKFEKYQIDFVRDLAEIIASSLSTVKINARTKQLLEQSQEQAEQMRSQEEEMRQNMEELQATQEEMERKTKEYEGIIKKYEQSKISS